VHRIVTAIAMIAMPLVTGNRTNWVSGGGARN